MGRPQVVKEKREIESKKRAVILQRRQKEEGKSKRSGRRERSVLLLKRETTSDWKTHNFSNNFHKKQFEHN